MSRLKILSLLSLMALAGLASPSAHAQAQNVCANFKPVPVQYEGQDLIRYKLTDSDQVRCLPAQPKLAWQVDRDWNQQDEANFGSFIQALGRSNCKSVDGCILNPANPYRSEEDYEGFHYADCADFPMYLRAYFAYKNHLPFVFGAGLSRMERTPEQEQKFQERRGQLIANGDKDGLQKFEAVSNDLRYTENGNFFTSQFKVTGSGKDFFGVITKIRDWVSSGSMRMLKTPRDYPLADFYSPQLSALSIRPGTVLYKVSGHVAIVYDVTPEGEVKFIDAHPDNSVTRGHFGRDYERSRMSQGWGFKNWRPYQLDRISYNWDRSIKSAQVLQFTDEQLWDYSLEQYLGSDSKNTNPANTIFAIANKKVGYYDYVNYRLSAGRFVIDPLVEFRKEIDDLCESFKNREISIETSIASDKKPQLASHPSNLPANIFGGDGLWEAYSTPGRDLRIKKMTLDLAERAKDFMNMASSKHPLFSYRGDNLKRDLIKAYHQGDVACKLGYKNSSGKRVSMGLSTAIDRLALMSFDPFLCTEYRNGARFESEKASCPRTKEKDEWYYRTLFLNAKTNISSDDVMGYSLQDLRRLDEASRAMSNQGLSKKFNVLEKLWAL